MYVTRPLALYKNHPELLSVPPAAVDGPGSGYLVVHNDNDVEYTSSRYGQRVNDESIKNLPFPQNKLITKIDTHYKTASSTSYIEGSSAIYDKEYDVAFIPVINQPLSSNCYYVIVANDTSLKGLAYTSATTKDTVISCFCLSDIPDKAPVAFNPHNIYQQFEFNKTNGGQFCASSVDPEGVPPGFLQRPGSLVHKSKHRKIPLGEAEGINSILRSQFPDFNFPSSTEYSQPKIVGKWYCPFMFVVEGSLKEQMERSMFYELTLEQQWERIYLCKRDSEAGSDSVAVNVILPTDTVKISWMDAVSERDEAKNMMWFWVMSEMGLQSKVGLSLVIVERMMWEQERVGWVGGTEKQVMVARMERYTGGDSWRNFGCYVLVEQFVLKRLDGSLVLTYEFKHTHRIRCKWD